MRQSGIEKHAVKSVSLLPKILFRLEGEAAVSVTGLRVLAQDGAVVRRGSSIFCAHQPSCLCLDIHV